MSQISKNSIICKNLIKTSSFVQFLSSPVIETCFGLTDFSAPALISDQISSSIFRSKTVPFRFIVLIKEPDSISQSFTLVPEAVAQR